MNHIPGGKVKVRGIKIPKWGKVLKYAVQAQKVSGLGYAGIDVVLDEEEGPLILEINARPGLQIQIANNDSLRTRLERVEGMSIPTCEYGIDLGKRLFAETALTDVPDSSNVLHVLEKITIYGPKGKKVVTAKIDTGAYRTSVDSALVEELGLVDHPQQKKVRSSLGREARAMVDMLFRLHGKDIETVATHTDRSHMRYPVIVGRKDLNGYLVDPKRFAQRSVEKKKEQSVTV